MAEISILLEDGPLLAVNKPVGIPTQSANESIPSVERLVKQYIRETANKPGNVYLGIPHRLDRVSTGVMVFARNSKTAARLAEQFAERSVRKIYLAAIEGTLPQEQGLLHDTMRKVPDQPRSEIVEEEADGAKEARLTYRQIKTWSDNEGAVRSLVEIELLTGRMHQIRLQFGSRGFPVVGDTLYGGTSRIVSDDEEPRILLHAHQLTLKHPIRYDEVTITAPLPDDWPEEATV